MTTDIYRDEAVSAALRRALTALVPGFVCTAAGFLTAFPFQFVGALPSGELVLLAASLPSLLLLLVNRRWPGILQHGRWFVAGVGLLVLMGIGYVLSDLYRGTTTHNLLRGWARVAFLAIDVIAVSHLIDGRWSRLWLFVLALVAGDATAAALHGPLFGEYWKFGYGAPLTILAFFLVGDRSKIAQFLVAVALGIVHLQLGFRSMGGTCLLVASILALRSSHGWWRPVAWLAAAGAFSFLILAFHREIIDRETPSGSNQERQSMLEAAGELFLESPLVGHGSWFTSTGLISRIEERRAAVDPDFQKYTAEEVNALAIHSQLLVALAEGGILAGGFFLAYGFLLIRTARDAARLPTPRRALFLFLALDALWGVAMSPFSGASRVWIAIGFTAMLLHRLHQRDLAHQAESQ